MQALRQALVAIDQRARAVSQHESGRLDRKLKALVATIDYAYGLLEGRRYKTELFEPLYDVLKMLAYLKVMVWARPPDHLIRSRQLQLGKPNQRVALQLSPATYLDWIKVVHANADDASVDPTAWCQHAYPS
jgi:hypothetical protein